MLHYYNPRAVGRSENPGRHNLLPLVNKGATNLKWGGGSCPPPPVEIGLTDLAKIWGDHSPPAPTALQPAHCTTVSLVKATLKVSILIVFQFILVPSIKS